MQTCSRNDVVLVRYPFSDLSDAKVRPGVVVSGPHVSQDVFIVPLTSRTQELLAGEFLLTEWKGAGLRVPTAVKRGIYTIHESLVAKSIGRLASADAEELERSLQAWLGLAGLPR